MALGNTVTLNVSAPIASQGNTFPASISGPWGLAIDAGGLDEADSGITRPDAFTISSRHVIRPFENCRGTSLVFAAFYASGDSAQTGGIYAVWGRNKKPLTATSEFPWTRLQNRARGITAQPTFAPSTDASNGTLQITVPDALIDVWDAIGFDEFIVGIVTPYDATGDKTQAGLYVKAI